MMRNFAGRRIRSARNQLHHRDRGDTLVEILVAVTILGFAGVALLGALLTSTAASVTHRNETTLDTVLRNFADDARYTIQTRPFTGTAGADPQFQPCAANASTYYVVSAPYPSSAAPGSTITAFSLGASSTDTVKLIGNTAVGQTASTTLTSTLNAATNVWTLTIPTGVGAPAASSLPYALAFTHGGTSYTAAGGLIVTSGSATSSAQQFANYSLTASLSRWNRTTSAFDPTTTCTTTPYPYLQQLTIQVVSTEAGSGASQGESILLSNVSPATTPTLTVADETVNLGQSVTLTATLTGATGSPGISDKVTWSNLNGNTCSGGDTTAIAADWTSECSLGTIPAQTFTPTATYSPAPSSTNAPAVGNGNATVNQGTITTFQTSSNPSSSPQPLGTQITFTATLTGSAAAFPPTGTVTWSSLPAGVSCSGPNPAPISSGKATCTVNSQLTASTYDPTATFESGDNNYPSGKTDNTATVTENTGTPLINFPNPPAQLQLDGSLVFTVNVNFPPDAVAPTGSVTWKINPPSGPSLPCASNTGPTATGPGQLTYTCTTAALLPPGSYSATFSIAKDSNYSANTNTSPAVLG